VTVFDLDSFKFVSTDWRVLGRLQIDDVIRLKLDALVSITLSMDVDVPGWDAGPDVLLDRIITTRTRCSF
jgi:hypothetical protein